MKHFIRVYWLTIFLLLPRLSYSETFQERAGQMRQIATNALSQVNQIVHNVIYENKVVAGIMSEIENIKQKIAYLKWLKEKTVEELKNGYYCDQCWRTKTEIEEQDHVSFQTHLSQVHGQMVPASQEKIKEKEDKFDRQINDLIMQISQKTIALNTAQSDLTAYHDQYQPAIIGSWRNSIVSEDKYRIEIWNEQLTKADAGADNLKSELKRLKDQYSGEANKKPVNETLLRDIENAIKDKQAEIEQAKVEKQNIINQQKAEKIAWIKLVLDEKKQIDDDLNNLQTWYSFGIMSLAGELNYDLINRVNSAQNTNMLKPDMGPETTNGNNSDAQNFLDNLGKK